MEISLNGIWQAAQYELLRNDRFQTLEYDSNEFTEVKVPGHWQDYPGFESYPDKVVFRKVFKLAPPESGQRAILEFEGVFYESVFWLNGRYLGEHKGYFDPIKFDITDRLNPEGNQVLVAAVYCPVEKDLNHKKIITGVFSHWDCKSPDRHPGGIWGGVGISIQPPVFIDAVRIVPMLQDDNHSALINIELDIEGFEGFKGQAAWKIRGHNFEDPALEGSLNLTLETDSGALRFAVELKNPKLWWTWDHGLPNLYIFEAEIRDSSGAPMGSVSRRFGIRSVNFDGLQMKLNGKRIFARGSNYGPSNIRLANSTRESCARDVELMWEANLNMIRIHAHVDRDFFYDLCDEAGIMVWQDFPLQWGYHESVLDEAVRQIKVMIRQMINHPSIVIWCCHNEPFFVADLQSESTLESALTFFNSVLIDNWNIKVLDLALDEAARASDPSRAVIRHSGILGVINAGTDAHFYFGWYMGRMRNIRKIGKWWKRNLRFITEYGAQAFPAVENLEKLGGMKSDGTLWDWEALKSDRMLQPAVIRKFTPPENYKTPEEYAVATQEYQARLIKFHNEYFRSLKYRPLNGAVHFLFTDCDIGVTWSVADYWRSKKPGFQALKESFSPLHIFVEFPNDEYVPGQVYSPTLYIVNDLDQGFPRAQIKVRIFEKERLLYTTMDEIDIEPDSLLKTDIIRWNFPSDWESEYELVLTLKAGDGKEIENRYKLISSQDKARKERIKKYVAAGTVAAASAGVIVFALRRKRLKARQSAEIKAPTQAPEPNEQKQDDGSEMIDDNIIFRPGD